MQDEGHTQTTQTDEFVGEDWVESLHPKETRHRPIPRIHYRLVTDRAGFRLSTFKGTQELLSATYDVFIGMGIVCHTGLSLSVPTL